MLVPRRPQIPGVASHDFLRRERDAAIHRLKDIRGDLRKVGRRQPRQLRFIFRRLAAAGEEQKYATARRRSSRHSRKSFTTNTL